MARRILPASGVQQSRRAEGPGRAIAERIQGRPLVLRQREGRGDPQPLSVSTSIHTDDVIETDDAARAALHASDGSSVRIDQSSRVRLIAPAVIELIAGAAYRRR